MQDPTSPSFRYRIYPEHRFGVVIWSERVTGDDVAEAVEKLFGSNEWEPGFAHLWDGRAMREFVLDLPGAVKTGKALVRLNERVGMGRAAIVVVRDFHRIGVEILVALGNVEDREVRYFPVLEQATSWLGVPVDLVSF